MSLVSTSLILAILKKEFLIDNFSPSFVTYSLQGQLLDLYLPVDTLHLLM